jgi:hypothetical protein
MSCPKTVSDPPRRSASDITIATLMDPTEGVAGIRVEEPAGDEDRRPDTDVAQTRLA